MADNHSSSAAVAMVEQPMVALDRFIRYLRVIGVSEADLQSAIRHVQELEMRRILAHEARERAEHGQELARSENAELRLRLKNEHVEFTGLMSQYTELLAVTEEQKDVRTQLEVERTRCMKKQAEADLTIHVCNSSTNPMKAVLKQDVGLVEKIVELATGPDLHNVLKYWFRPPWIELVNFPAVKTGAQGVLAVYHPDKSTPKVNALPDAKDRTYWTRLIEIIARRLTKDMNAAKRSRPS